MSNHNPLATEITAAGLDGVITSIQQTLKDSYFSKVFHRAYLFEERDGKKPVTVPKCWEQGDEWIIVLPNDAVRSQIFFLPVGDEVVVGDYEANVEPQFTSEIALIFWCDVRYLPGNTKTSYNPSLATVKKDLLTILNAHDGVTKVTELIDKSAGDIFKGIDINDAKTHYTMLPFAGLRINFEVSYNYRLC